MKIPYLSNLLKKIPEISERAVKKFNEYKYTFEKSWKKFLPQRTLSLKSKVQDSPLIWGDVHQRLFQATAFKFINSWSHENTVSKKGSSIDFAFKARPHGILQRIKIGKEKGHFALEMKSGRWVLHYACVPLALWAGTWSCWNTHNVFS